MKKYSGLIKSQLKHLFPDIRYNPDSEYTKCKRVVLFLMNTRDGTLEVRNYFIRKAFSGMHKKIKKLLNNEKVMDFSKVKDVSDLFLAEKVEFSDSDIDNLGTKLEVEKSANGKNIKTEVNLRLYEIGPRLSLKLVKIEEEFLKGEVLYHAFNQKSEQAILDTRKKIEDQEALRIKRRLNQEENVKRKEGEKLGKRSNKKFLEDNKKTEGNAEGEKDEEGEGEDGEEVEEREAGEEDLNESDKELLARLENDFV